MKLGEMKLNKIYRRDCVVGMKDLSDRSIDLVIADPPYFKTINEKWDYKWRLEEDYLVWAEGWIKEIARVVKITGCFYLFGYFKILAQLMPIIIKYGFELRQQIIVDKGMRSVSGRKTSTYKMFPTTTESILFFNYNSKPTIKPFLKEQQEKAGLSAKEINERLEVESNGGGVWSLYTGENILAQVPTKEMWGRLQKVLNFEKPYEEIAYIYNPQMGLTDVWRDIDFYEESRNGDRNHSTQKPLKLIERLIIASSNEGMTVLDPFMGSGTTAVACKKLHREFIGFESDKKMCKAANKRLKMKKMPKQTKLV